MTRDEQEAFSRFHGPTKLHVLALSSGNWAILDHANSILAIVPLNQITYELVTLTELLANAPAKPEYKPVSNEPINLEELGLL